MDRRALFLTAFVLLICAGAVSAQASGIDKPRAVSTALVWRGAGNVPQLIPAARIAPQQNRLTQVLYEFPTSFPSPVNRYDWSRWLGWIIIDL